MVIFMNKIKEIQQTGANMILSGKASFIHQKIRKNTIFAVFCAIFAAIYEHFSHRVYSPYMICAFLFPVCLGIVPDIIRLRLYESPKYIQKNGQINSGNKTSHIYEISLVMQQCGIYTFTVGSIFRGILDIYGITNALSAVYWWAGAVLFIGGVAINCVRR